MCAACARLFALRLTPKADEAASGSSIEETEGRGEGRYLGTGATQAPSNLHSTHSIVDSKPTASEN